jgi:hypothetical protein
MATFTDGNIRDILAHFGIADDPVAALGISGIDERNDIGVYDDRFYHSVDGKIASCPGNVDPSSLAPGRATLLTNRVFHWRPGVHGLSKPPDRRYPAFVQAEEVTVIRHRQGADTGWFGINHHRGGVNGTSSLGCQTYPQDCWNEARARLYEGVGATVSGVENGTKKGRPFPYVVVPLSRAREILARGGDTAAISAPPPVKKAPTWTIRLKGKPGQPDEVYDKAINIGGRVFVPVRDFCVAALDCKPEAAPLQWVDGPGEMDVLEVQGMPAKEVTEIGDRAYVWIVEVAKALGFKLTKNEPAKNLVLEK